METNPNEKPTTSKAAKDGNSNIINTSTFSKPPTSPTSLRLALKHPSTASFGQPATPTLGQIGKQGSINFRHSQLYDSDADDQTHLIRGPSIRSHKFIIIPATSPLGDDQKKFPTAMSSSSLSSLQKLPLRSPTNQNLNDLIMTPTTPSASPKTAAFRSTQQQPLITKSPSLLMSRSDVTHPSTTVSDTRVTKPTASSSVKFTIEDYESDNATDATTTVTITHKEIN